MVKINVKETIKNTIAMSTEDGKILYEKINKELKLSNKVELSFDGIDMLISHFLNESIGKQYECFDNWDTLDKAIEYRNIDEDDLELLIEKVIPTAKNHFRGVKKEYSLSKSILDD